MVMISSPPIILIKRGLILLTFLFIGSTSFSQKKIGLQLYSFRNELSKDLPGTMEKISKMGIKELEGGGLYGLQPGEYKSLLEKYQLTIVSVGADFNELDSNLQKPLERAKLFNAKYVVCFWIPHNGNEFGIEDANKAIAVFNKAGKFFKEHGLSFCYHPHGYEFRPFSNQTIFDHMVQKMDSRSVNFEMDVFWVKHPGQDPVALLKKYPNRFPLLHLKDRRIGTIGNQNGQADEETNVVLGTGDVDIKAILKTANKLKGVKYYFIEDESSRAMDQVPKSIAYLKALK